MLTSIKNPKVAAAVRLKKRAFREEDRCFLVEGAQGVGEALEHPADLRSLFVVDDLDPLAVRARQAGVEVHAVSDDVMGKLTSTVTPQGIVGRVSVPRRRASTRCPSTDASRSSTRCAIPGTPARCSARPMPPAPTAWCSPPARSIRTTRRPCVRRPDRSSICRSCGARRPRSAVQGRARSRSAGPRDGRARRSGPLHGGPQRSPPRSCSATRRTDCPRRSWRWRMRGCACRIEGRPNRSTSPQPPPCACSNGPAVVTAAPSPWRRSWPRPRTTSARRSRR